MNLLIMAAMLVCLGIGFYLGWLYRDDRFEGQALEVRHPQGRHARTWELRLTPADPPTDELIAIGYGGTE